MRLLLDAQCRMPGVIDLRNADVHIASDALIAYCENLTKAVQSAKERVEVVLADSTRRWTHKSSQVNGS